MMNNLNINSIVVGVDVHKYSHTAVALNCWGQEKGRLDFSNDNLLSYAKWLLSLTKKENVIVALEDANGYGVHIVSELARQGIAMRYVPAILTERARKRSTQRDKSDYLDAKRVGKVVLAKYEETLPAKESIADEEELGIAKAMDLLLSERRDLVRQKTIVKNQLHALLHQYYGDHYKDNFSKPFNKKAIKFYVENLKQTGNKEILAQGILRRLNRLIFVENQIVDINKELSCVGEKAASVQKLEEEIHGCGLVTACAIMAEIYTIKRFKNKAQLAKYAGAAPTTRESGAKNKVYTNPFGNRLLNKAIHTIALAQISVRGDERGKIYYRKKLAEGKTKLWSLRCLKRQISNRIFQTLKQVD